MTLRLATIALLLMGAADAGEVVRLGDIGGARLAEGETWRLALAGPEFGGVLTRQCALDLRPEQPASLIDVPDDLAGRDFTVLLELAEVEGGLLRLMSERVPDDVRTVMVSQDGWRAVHFGPAQWQGNLSLSVTATAPMSIRRVTVYRGFEQVFGRHGQVALLGAAYHKLGPDALLSPPLLPGSYRHHRTGLWNETSVGKEDGIGGGMIDEHYRAFFNGPLQAESGLAVPVSAPGGIVFCARLKGKFALVVYPEVEKNTLTWTGEAGEWSVASLPFDPSVLDGDGNGIFTGYKKLHWAHAKTWVENYGTGFLDFITALPQNEIRVNTPPAERLSFDYESVEGMRTQTVALPEGTTAVALVNGGPRRTEILLRSATGYAPAATIEDSAWFNCLGVRAGSIRLTP